MRSVSFARLVAVVAMLSSSSAASAQTPPPGAGTLPTVQSVTKVGQGVPTLPAGGERDASATTGSAPLATLSAADRFPPSLVDRIWLVNNVPNVVDEIAARDPASYRKRGPTWNLPQTDTLFVEYYRKHLPPDLPAGVRPWVEGLALTAPEVETLDFTTDATTGAPDYVVGTGCDPKACAATRFVVAFNATDYHFFAGYRTEGHWHAFGDGDFRSKEMALVVLARDVVNPALRFPLLPADVDAVSKTVRDFTAELMGPEQETDVVPPPETPIVP